MHQTQHQDTFHHPQVSYLSICQSAITLIPLKRSQNQLRGLGLKFAPLLKCGDVEYCSMEIIVQVWICAYLLGLWFAHYLKFDEVLNVIDCVSLCTKQSQLQIGTEDGHLRWSAFQLSSSWTESYWRRNIQTLGINPFVFGLWNDQQTWKPSEKRLFHILLTFVTMEISCEIYDFWPIIWCTRTYFALCFDDLEWLKSNLSSSSSSSPCPKILSSSFFKSIECASFWWK